MSTWDTPWTEATKSPIKRKARILVTWGGLAFIIFCAIYAIIMGFLYHIEVTLQVGAVVVASLFAAWLIEPDQRDT